jgi:hypothetical protein
VLVGVGVAVAFVLELVAAFFAVVLDWETGRGSEGNWCRLYSFCSVSSINPTINHLLDVPSLEIKRSQSIY